jgi:hypothetical protein
VKKEDQRTLVQEAYSLVGGVATGFSTLDFHLQFLLSVLVSGKEASPQAILVLRQKTFGQKIQLLEDIVSLNFPRGSQLRSRGQTLVKALNKLREKRNLYIHGYWLINYEVIASTGGVRCSDTKWRFDKKTDSWTSMPTHDISFRELRNYIQTTGDLFKELYSFNDAVLKELRSKTSQPHRKIK